MNNMLNNQIRVENKEAFTNMSCYLRGENIRAVIGEDLKAFLLAFGIMKFMLLSNN